MGVSVQAIVCVTCGTGVLKNLGGFVVVIFVLFLFCILALIPLWPGSNYTCLPVVTDGVQKKEKDVPYVPCVHHAGHAVVLVKCSLCQIECRAKAHYCKEELYLFIRRGWR